MSIPQTLPSRPLETYQVYAIRYATMDRVRKNNFIGRDAHDDHDMPMDFFVWLIRSEKRVVLVDTGFNQASADRRNRVLERCPMDALTLLGVRAEDIEDVVLTHLHYDHAGNLNKLPKAKIHVQEQEVAYATGPCMCFKEMRHAYDVQDVSTLLEKIYGDRVVFYNGDGQVAPGIELKLIGGHTQGLQAVRVNTKRGWVVLASDASHYYENYQSYRPFPIVLNISDMLNGHRKLRSLAETPEHIVPGHDPQVLTRYPTVDDCTGIVSLHCAPLPLAA